jgi:hypothetical protein
LKKEKGNIFMSKIIAISAVAMFVNLFQIANASAQTVVAQVNTVSQKVQTVSLFDNGELRIYDYGRNVKSMKLSGDNAKSLLGLAESLSGAELTVIHRQVVCMMIIAGFNSRNLSVLQADGSMKMTLSTDICSTPDTTKPAVSYQLQAAQTLRDQLAVLADQLAD